VVTSARSVLSRACACTILLFATQLGAARTPPAPLNSSGVPTTTVVYRFVQLQSDAGALRILNQIQSAAHVVCHAFQPDSLFIPTPAWRTCVRAAMARAIASVQSPRLTELWMQRYPGASLSIGASEPTTARISPSSAPPCRDRNISRSAH
jgi:UrcA family protein